MILPRRQFVICGLLACATPVMAADDQRFDYRGHSVDLSAVPGGERAGLAAYIRQQIDLVEGLAIREDIKVWFRTIGIGIDPTLNMPGRFREGQLTLDDSVSPPDNPVLLHELLHAYMAERLPRTGELRRFYAAAMASGDWPAQAYMLSNINEFFAMTASVALWGQAARAPGTRERLRAAMPEYYGWLVREFGLQA
ncbi:hypothetical protein ACIQC9_11850 [Brevundimonas sp. NPDC092305]|uniref:hypothetical protein n=1 Tax=Brevundimonas sp. NPDC092305 TaxID=3363957 RepID=UPI0038245ADD